jgi:hypothetical protein
LTVVADVKLTKVEGSKFFETVGLYGTDSFEVGPKVLAVQTNGLHQNRTEFFQALCVVLLRCFINESGYLGVFEDISIADIAFKVFLHLSPERRVIEHTLRHKYLLHFPCYSFQHIVFGVHLNKKLPTPHLKYIM